MSSKIDTAQVETCIAAKMFDHFYREGKKNGEVIHSKDCFIEYCDDQMTMTYIQR